MWITKQERDSITKSTLLNVEIHIELYNASIAFKERLTAVQTARAYIPISTSNRTSVWTALPILCSLIQCRVRGRAVNFLDVFLDVHLEFHLGFIIFHCQFVFFSLCPLHPQLPSKVKKNLATVLWKVRYCLLIFFQLCFAYFLFCVSCSFYIYLGMLWNLQCFY